MLLDTTSRMYFLKTGSGTTYDPVGIYSEDLEQDFGTQEKTSHYVYQKGSVSVVTGYEKAVSVDTLVDSTDPVYVFVSSLVKGNKTLDACKAEIVVADMWTLAAGKAEARKYSCTIVPGKDKNSASDGFSITYEIKFNGDPTQGTVAVDASLKATFTANP